MRTARNKHNNKNNNNNKYNTLLDNGWAVASNYKKTKNKKNKPNNI